MGRKPKHSLGELALEFVGRVFDSIERLNARLNDMDQKIEHLIQKKNGNGNHC